jgi:aryl-alcohol dehydrogenase-like predicted oxidoreductase
MLIGRAVNRPQGSYRSFHHAAVLASVSTLTLLAAGTPTRAGNILGGGGTAAVSNATAAALAKAQQAAQVAQQAQNALTRATQAIQATQSAARNLVLSARSAMASGLAAGGLVPDSGLASTGVANPVT